MSLPRRRASDRAGPSAKSAFLRARKVEKHYAARLRGVAKTIGDIVRAFAGDLNASPRIQDALERYAALLRPWAEAVGRRMVTEVAQRDEQAWFSVSAEIGRGLRKEIETAPTGAAMRQALSNQVELITSLPRQAAERVHKLTIQGISNGARADEIAAEIMRTGEVTKSRANLIARTEVSRTATELTKARAEHVGSTHFIWHTAGDSDVRPTHKKLNGQVFRWDQPPECDPGHHALPGAIWNCRCWAEPIIPEN